MMRLNRVRLGLAAAATLSILLGSVYLGLTAAAAAGFSVQDSGLAATTSGTSVTASVTLTASSPATAQQAGICGRDSSNAIADFPLTTNVALSTTGTKITQTRSFAPGSYSFFACTEVDGVWYGGSTYLQVQVSAAPSNALTHWQSALDGRRSAPATWLAVGDSLVEGQGATTKVNRWIDQTLGMVRSSYPTTGVIGGPGFLPGYYATYGSDSPWQPYSARTGTISNVNYVSSFGDRTIVMNANSTQSYVVTGTSVDLFYATNGGTFTYSVDGVVKGTVNTAGAYQVANKTRVTLATKAQHTVKITAKTGTVYFEGLIAYNGDEAKGVRLIDDAHSGFQTSDYLYTVTGLDTLLPLVKPDLITIDLAANEYLRNTGTPEQVRANLKSIIANYRSVPGIAPSIVLVVPYGISANPDNPRPWSDYQNAMKSVTVDDPTIGILDFSTVNMTGLLSSDGLHPNNAGQTAIAKLAASYLTTR